MYKRNESVTHRVFMKWKWGEIACNVTKYDILVSDIMFLMVIKICIFGSKSKSFMACSWHKYNTVHINEKYEITLFH